MERFKSKATHSVILQCAKALNILLVSIPFAFVWCQYYSQYSQIHFGARGDFLLFALFLFVYTVLVHIYDGLYVSFYRISEMTYSQILSAALSYFIAYIVVSLLGASLLNPLPMIGALAVSGILAALWCVVVRKQYYKKLIKRKVAVIYDARERFETVIAQSGLLEKYDIDAVMHISEVMKDIECLEDMDEIFLSGIHSHERNQIMKYCVTNGIRVYVIPRIGDEIIQNAKRVHLFHLPMMQIDRYNPSVYFIVIKRLFDITASAIALVLLSPILLVTAFLIHKEDGGPVFYKQLRVGKDRKTFDILKFRSMRVDAEKFGAVKSTGDADPRITKVGRIIRKCRIDELPQLINILRGDMSIVGPRPERIENVEEYEAEMPEFALRLQAPAGLTGYAQVYGKYNTTPYDKLLMDLHYIGNQSLWNDFKIILATIRILFIPESTEGFTEEATSEEARKNLEISEPGSDFIKNPEYEDLSTMTEILPAALPDAKGGQHVHAE